MSRQPLLELFRDLQNAGLPLGIGAYRVLRRAMRGGFGLESPEALLELCQLVWATDLQERSLIAHHFEELLGRLAPEDQPEAPRPGAKEGVEPERPRVPPEVAQSARQVGEGAGEEAPVAGPGQLMELLPAPLTIEALVARPPDLVRAEYFPVSRRQMRQSWRHLRRSTRHGPSTELDIEQTVSALARTGILLAPVMVPRRVNRAALLVLIDRGGSMAPFHRLSEALRESAASSGISHFETAYFHDVPGAELYRDPSRVEGEPAQTVYARFARLNAALAVVSDAGAARGDYDAVRAAATAAFLSRARAIFTSLVWVNPVPRSRWSRTTAQRTAEHVPMFELTRAGLDRAVDVLRGKRPPRLSEAAGDNA